MGADRFHRSLRRGARTMAPRYVLLSSLEFDFTAWERGVSAPINIDRNAVLSVVHGDLGVLRAAAWRDLEVANAGR